MLLPVAVFTADNELIITVTLDLSVQACKNASLSLANVAWYVLHACTGADLGLEKGGFLVKWARLRAPRIL